MSVHLEPESFTMVKFDADELRRVAGDVATRLGLGDEDIALRVDERSSLGGITLSSLDPIAGEIESGAIEDPQHIRMLSPVRSAEAIGRLLLEALDRRRDGFGAPPLGEVVPLGARVAWDVHLVGRLSRLGFSIRRQRRRYQFRVRHGFSDRADAAFDRLWSSEDLTFADLVACSAEAEAAPVDT